MQTQQKQSRIVDAIISEIDQEARITKRLLDIVPDEKLDWRPHPKAMSLGQLAMHVAENQRVVAEMTQAESASVPDFVQPQAASRAELLAVFAEGTEKAKAILSETSDEKALGEWRIVNGGETVMAMPRVAFWRMVMLNHNYHHRGQLSTYLRTLDIPLPSIYGPSADAPPAG